MLPEALEHALTSPWKLFFICMFTGFPVPFPEDIIVMTVGTLVAAGHIEFWEAALACGAGMFIRDLNAFLVAHRFSDWLMKQDRVRAFVGEKNIERWSKIFERNGWLGIFLVRFAVGTRVKLLFVAAALGVRRRTFIIADLVGMCIVAPLLLWLGYRFGEPLIQGVKRAMAYSGPIVTVALIAVGLWAYFRWRSSRVVESVEPAEALAPTDPLPPTHAQATAGPQPTGDAEATEGR